MSTRFTTHDGRVYQFYAESDGDVTYQQVDCQPGQFHMGSVGDMEFTKRYLDTECGVKQWEGDTSI